MTQINENPYIGPRTFTRQDSYRFFGREHEARELLSLVISERLVLFYAQSGAGKSSLINARLIPNLPQAGFAVLPLGRVSGQLPAGVEQVSNIFAFNLILSLDQSERNPARFAQMSLPDFLARLVRDEAERYTYQTEIEEAYTAAPHVLLIDQFEEIITTHPTRWPEREAFFRQLDQAMNADPLLWVVLSLREDYLAALEAYAPLLTGKMRARFYMQRMAYPAALEAIKKPAEQAGRPFAPGVAESLVDNLRQIQAQNPSLLAESPKNNLGGQRSAVGGRSLGQFVEPVQLQVVCYRLWENLLAKDPSNPVPKLSLGTGLENPLDSGAEITQADLQAIGNVDKALAEFYEQAIARVALETGVSEIEVRDWFERQLITEAGTRGSVYRGAEKTGGLSTRAADLLVNQFLLRTENRAGGIWYELGHDRFIEPIQQANRAWRWQQPLLQMAQSWLDSGRSESKLLTGPALSEALASNRPGLGALVEDFLAASQAAQQAREAAIRAEQEAQRQSELEQARALAQAQTKAAQRLRWVVVALALMVFILMGLVGMTVYAMLQRQEVSVSHETITTSLPVDGRLYVAVASDGRTVNVTDTARNQLIYSLTGATAPVTKVSLSPNLAYLAASDRNGATLVWNLSTGGFITQLSQHAGPVRYVVFSPDSRLMATGGDDGTTKIWDTSTWQIVSTLVSGSGSIISVAFWEDTSRVVTASTDGTYSMWDPWTGEKIQ